MLFFFFIFCGYINFLAIFQFITPPPPPPRQSREYCISLEHANVSLHLLPGRSTQNNLPIGDDSKTDESLMRGSITTWKCNLLGFLPNFTEWGQIEPSKKPCDCHSWACYWKQDSLITSYYDFLSSSREKCPLMFLLFVNLCCTLGLAKYHAP